MYIFFILLGILVIISIVFGNGTNFLFKYINQNIILKNIFLIFSIIFIYMFYKHLVIVSDELNWTVSVIVSGYAISRMQEFLKMEKSRKKFLIMIPYALFCFLCLVTSFLSFVLITFAKPRVVVNKYKIGSSEYIKLETDIYESYTSVVYEKEFGLDIYCNNTISSIRIIDEKDNKIYSKDAMKKIDLKKYYNLIKDKKIGLCGTKIKKIEEYYSYNYKTKELTKKK